MTKIKTKAHSPRTVSNEPGGFLPSAYLARANTFGAMRHDLEAALSGDRNEILTAVREAVAGYEPEFDSHRATLLSAANSAEANGRLRDFETAVADKATFFANSESSVLGLAPKNPSEVQIHAAALNLANTTAADKYRVRYSSY